MCDTSCDMGTYRHTTSFYYLLYYKIKILFFHKNERIIDTPSLIFKMTCLFPQKCNRDGRSRLCYVITKYDAFH